jgi:hypothetical protein
MVSLVKLQEGYIVSLVNGSPFKLKESHEEIVSRMRKKLNKKTPKRELFLFNLEY